MRALGLARFATDQDNQTGMVMRLAGKREEVIAVTTDLQLATLWLGSKKVARLAENYPASEKHRQ